MSSTATAALTAAFEETFPRVGQAGDADGDVVLTPWPSVPCELVRAAGLRPLVTRGSAAPTSLADAHLEADIFPNRIRQLVDAALDGRLSRLARLVIPRTSDPDYKAYLYLREFERRGVVRDLAPTLLFDLLQSNGPVARRYAVARTRALFDALTTASDRSPSEDDLRLAISRSNAARAAARQLVALRQGAPRISGTEVLPLLGAFWQMEPARYAALASEAASEIARRPPLEGPRVLLTGAPVDGTGLHTGIERHGAIVVDEAGPWGSEVAGEDVRIDEDPIAALADSYRTAFAGPRRPRETDASLRRRLDRVDAVVVSLPPDDAVFGWEYLRVREQLEAQGIPHVVLRGDPYAPLSAADHARLDALVGAASRSGVRQVRRG